MMGGVFQATEDRFGAFDPYLVSPMSVPVGALDMVNFGSTAYTVPEKYAQGRTFVRAQPAGHADAHHRRGERRDGPLDR